jgi:hypothetical protein
MSESTAGISLEMSVQWIIPMSCISSTVPSDTLPHISHTSFTLPKLTDESKSRIFFSFSSDIAYVRWHGRGKKMWYNYRYSKDELAEWMPRIKEMSRSTQVYGYFNNHNHGYAPENCLDVLEILGVATTEQKEARQHISDYWKGKVKGKVVTTTLNDFLEPEKEDVMTLLLEYIDASRLDRANEIKDIEMIELSKDKIIADVRGYSVYIDLKKWFILHDCGDWRRTQRERRFCKHIGGLMLALPEDATRGVLDGIKRQMWEFSQYTGRGEA